MVVISLSDEFKLFYAVEERNIFLVVVSLTANENC